MCRQKGFTLLEVLISLVIIAVVFLGFSSLHILGAQVNQDSLQRLVALQYAEDLSSRLANNRVAVFDNTYAALDFNSTDCASPPPVVCQAHTSETLVACTPQQMAAFDAYAVFCALESPLPELEIDITCADIDGSDAEPCSMGSPNRINIAWGMPGWKESGGAVTHFGADECPLVATGSLYHKSCVEFQVIP